MKHITKLIITAILAVFFVPMAGTAANAAAPTSPLYVGGIGADSKIIAKVFYGVLDEMPSSLTLEATLANNDGSPTVSSCTVAVPSTRCTITGLTNGTPYYVRAFTSNNDGASSKVYGAWAVTPTSGSVIYAAEYDCSTDVYRVQPCQLSGTTTNATVYGQGLQLCTEIDAIGGGLPGGTPIAITPSVDGTSAVIHITAGAMGWANFNCGVGNLSSFLGYTVSYLGQSGFVPTWSQNTGPAGTVVELTSTARFFVGITRLQLQGVDVSYSVVTPNRILITIPSGLAAGWSHLSMDSLGGTGTVYNVWNAINTDPTLSFDTASVSPCGSTVLTLSNINPNAHPAIYFDGNQVPAVGVFASDPINLTWELIVMSSGNASGYLANDVVFTIRYINDSWDGMSPVPFSDSYLASASVTLRAGWACGTQPQLNFGSIAPSSGPVAGGTQVTITGTGFDQSTGVSIGGAPCQIISRAETEIICVTPSGLAGSADIVISSEGSEPVTALNAFTFIVPKLISIPKKPTPSQVDVKVGQGSLAVTMTYEGTAEFKPSGYTAYVKPGGNSCVIPQGAASCEIIGLKPGIDYTLVITAVNAAGISPSLTLPDSYLIGEKSPLKLFAKLGIRPFAGNSAVMTKAFRAQIRKFVVANPKLTAFTCTGYTAGKPVIKSDRKLAKARASAVCGYIAKLRPNAAVTVIGLTPGLSFAANNRKVLVQGYGLDG